MYYIWKERNARLFANENMNSENVLQKIIENMLQLQSLSVIKSYQVCKVAGEWNVDMNWKKK